MKILSIRGENLASLTGEFVLDFREAPLADAGLFAITGPTGAGKSTLLDALCLGLYGSYPRLETTGREKTLDVAGDEIAADSVNNVMSRGKGSCAAIVEFEGVDGEEYRASWRLRRAKEKPDGKLQAPARELVRLRDALVVADKVRDVDERVKALTGLTFEQFRRTCLLAQGQFDSFLRADGGERSKLLERVTGAEIYTQISVKVFELTREAQARVVVIRGELEKVPRLSEEQLAQVQAAMATQQQLVDAAAAQLKRIEESLQARDREQKALEQLRVTTLEAQRAEEAWNTLAPQRQRLEFLERIEPLKELFTTASERALLEKTAKEEWERDSKAKADADAALAAAEERSAQSSEAYQAALAEVSKWEPLWTEAKALEVELRGLNDRKADAERDATAKAADAARLIGIAEQAKRNFESLDQQVQKLKDWLSQHPGFEQVASQRAKLVELLEARSAKNVDASRASLAEWKQRVPKLAIAQANLATAVKEAPLARQWQELTQRATELEQQEREQRARAEEAAHSSLLAEQSASEAAAAMRAALRDGEPCPVCGSKTHALDEHTGALANALKQRRDELAQTLRATQKEQQSVAGRLALAADARDRLAAIEGLPSDGLEEALATTALELEHAQQAVAQLEIEHALQPLVMPLGLSIAEAVAQRADLGQQMDGYVVRAAQLDSLTVKLREAELAVGPADANVIAVTTALAEAQGRFGRTAKAALAIHQRRVALKFEPENAVRQRLEAAQKESTHAGNQAASASATLKQLKASVTEREGKLTKATEDLDEARRQFQQQCDAITVEANEAKLGLKAIAAELPTLRKQVQDGRTQQATAKAKLEDAERGAEAARCEGLPAQAELERAKLDQQEQQRNANQEIGTLKQRLAQNAKELETRKQLEAQLAKANDAMEVHAAVNQAVGSADGTKFRRFVQGLTLDHLVHLANYHLGTFASRYQLRRSPVGELGLEVADSEMIDAVRLTSTLSGGERFLVSLGLALGLSSLEGKDTFVDSLFIDEGFGSLDAESLELVVAALESLPSSGRRVGVITHVAAMMDRIAVQVRVTKKGEGRSAVRIVDGQRESTANTW